MAVERLGGGRSHPSQQIDPAVGFSQLVPAGQLVQQGDVLAKVHAASVEAAQVAAAEFLQALQVTDTAAAAYPLVHHTIG
jgi:thymidine phosphorylase